MASGKSEVHVGDVRTTYKVKITDAGAPFDPTTATTKEIIFKMPQGIVTLPAVVVSEPPDYFLEVLIDGTGATANFHSMAGNVEMQAHVQFADGGNYHSAIETRDAADQPLKVHANLS